MSVSFRSNRNIRLRMHRTMHPATNSGRRLPRRRSIRCLVFGEPTGDDCFFRFLYRGAQFRIYPLIVLRLGSYDYLNASLRIMRSRLVEITLLNLHGFRKKVKCPCCGVFTVETMGCQRIVFKRDQWFFFIMKSSKNNAFALDLGLLGVIHEILCFIKRKLDCLWEKFT